MKPTKNIGTAPAVTSAPAAPSGADWCERRLRATMSPMRTLVHTICRAVLLLGLSVPAGCGRGDATTAIERDRFVETIVELRHAAMETRGDTAAYEVRKQQILQEQGVTEAELRDYVERRGRDVEHMAEVWNEINTRLGERFQTTLH
jgi:hypothetical protein